MGREALILPHTPQARVGNALRQLYEALHAEIYIAVTVNNNLNTLMNSMV